MVKLDLKKIKLELTPHEVTIVTATLGGAIDNDNRVFDLNKKIMGTLYNKIHKQRRKQEIV